MVEESASVTVSGAVVAVDILRADYVRVEESQTGRCLLCAEESQTDRCLVLVLAGAQQTPPRWPCLLMEPTRPVQRSKSNDAGLLVASMRTCEVRCLDGFFRGRTAVTKFSNSGCTDHFTALLSILSRHHFTSSNQNISTSTTTINAPSLKIKTMDSPEICD